MPVEARNLIWTAIVVMVVLQLLPILFMDVQPTSDMSWYYERALGLIESGHYAEAGLPTAYWPVGYPAFLAGVMALFGKSVLVGQLANLALSVLGALLMFRLCLRHFKDERIATISVFLLAVCSRVRAAITPR